MKLDDLNIRLQIIEACKWLTSMKLVYGTWGNISVRYGDGLLITPSRVDYDVLSPEDMVYMDFDGKILSGSRIPSSEREIHRLVLKNRTDAGAVVHTHSPYACAAAAAGIELPPLIEEIPQLIGGAVPCTPYYIPGGEHLRLAELTVSTIGDKNAVLIKNHGPVCCGVSLEEALTCCQVTEKAAFMTLTLNGHTAYTAIPDEDVREERQRYLFKYGRE